MRLGGFAGRLVTAAAVLGLAACGQGGGADSEGGPGLSTSQRPALTEDDMRQQSEALLAGLGAAADAATRAQYEGAFDAVGAEPDWRLTVLPDYVSFTRPGLDEVTAIPSPRDFRAGGAYIAAGPLSIALKAGACTYIADGDSYPYSATILFEGIAYEGCARPGADVGAPDNTRGWAMDLSELLPAIDVCLTRVEAKPGRVTIAYPNENNQIGVRLLEADGGRSECLVAMEGLSIVSYLPLADRDTFRGERDPLFTRAPAAAPAGACFATEEVKGSSGATLGWLSRKTC
ncbi:MAG: hypothetical protein NW200_00815 [Hyphomonadaceae bacterium]|nr:hypothetical protein [Hyphomonadaceae bacterium]